MTNETNPGTVDMLLPCPFCGADADYSERMDEDLSTHDQALWRQVRCPDCEGPSFEWPDGYEGGTAMERWNTRAAQSQPAATVQEVGRLTDAKILDIAANPICSPCSPWWLKDDVLLGDVQQAALSFARAIESALTAEPAAKAGDAEPESDWELECKAFAYANDLKLSANVRDFIKELWKAYCLASPSPQPDMGRDRVIMSSVRLGKWMSAALDDPNVCEEMKADIRDWFSAGEPVVGWAAALSPPASQSVEKVRKALRPFAEYRGSDEYLKSAEDDGLCVAASFTAGDYRRARDAYAALSTLPHKEEATPAPVEQGVVGSALRDALDDLTRPIIGIEYRNAEEVFAIMRDRLLIKIAATPATTTERGRG